MAPSVLAACAAHAVGTSVAGATGAGPFVCEGEFNNLVVTGNLVVPSDAQCDIGADSTVTGNVSVGPGARFSTSFGSEVDGYITGETGSAIGWPVPRSAAAS